MRAVPTASPTAGIPKVYTCRMTRNPVINALATIAYIVLVAALLSTMAQFLPEPTNPFGPIAGFLSLFVFSAAVTGYLVIGMPLRLFLEGEKKEAVALFAKTLVAFAIAGVLLFFASFFIPSGTSQAFEVFGKELVVR